MVWDSEKTVHSVTRKDIRYTMYPETIPCTQHIQKRYYLHSYPEKILCTQCVQKRHQVHSVSRKDTMYTAYLENASHTHQYIQNLAAVQCCLGNSLTNKSSVQLTCCLWQLYSLSLSVSLANPVSKHNR